MKRIVLTTEEIIPINDANPQKIIAIPTNPDCVGVVKTFIEEGITMYGIIWSSQYGPSRRYPSLTEMIKDATSCKFYQL